MLEVGGRKSEDRGQSSCELTDDFYGVYDFYGFNDLPFTVN